MTNPRADEAAPQAGPWFAGPWWIQAGLVLLFAAQWQHELTRQLPFVPAARAAARAGLTADTSAWIGTLAQLGWNGIECLFYVTWWRRRDVPWRRRAGPGPHHAASNQLMPGSPRSPNVRPTAARLAASHPPGDHASAAGQPL